MAVSHNDNSLSLWLVLSVACHSLCASVMIIIWTLETLMLCAAFQSKTTRVQGQLQHWWHITINVSSTFQIAHKTTTAAVQRVPAANLFSSPWNRCQSMEAPSWNQVDEPWTRRRLHSVPPLWLLTRRLNAFCSMHQRYVLSKIVNVVVVVA